MTSLLCHCAAIVSARLLFVGVAFAGLAGGLSAQTNVSGAITENTTWTISGSPYLVSSLSVQPGATLTVEPGVVVKLYNDNILIVSDGGSLVAEGTAEAPVVFTSVHDDTVGGDTDGAEAINPTDRRWGELYFATGSVGRLSHAIVRYGGNASSGQAMVRVAGAADVRIADSELAYASNYGVKADNADLLSISNSNLIQMPVGVYNQSGSTLDASNNWWGDSSGPNDPDPDPSDDIPQGNPDGQGVSVLGDVRYRPWATTPFSIIPPAPDLVVEDLQLSPQTAGPGETLRVSFTVANQGDGAAQSSTFNVRLNQSPNRVTTDDLLLDQFDVPGFSSGASLRLSVNVTLPSDLASGAHYVWVIADVGSTAGQRPADEGNDRQRARLAPPLYGTTIITHGLSGPDDGFGDSGFEEDQSWAVNMASAMLQRIGKGRVFVICGDGGGPRPCYSGSSDEIVPFGGVGDDRRNGEQIIVFDWLQESRIPMFGFSEGAASALTALLLQGVAEDKWDLDQLHFLGHSRGSVVLSEVIQRLGAYAAQPSLLPEGVVIDDAIHFTPLDPHPWDQRTSDAIGDPGSAFDHYVNGSLDLDGDGSLDEPSGVICWSNVEYGDSYWQDAILGDLPIYELNGLPSVPGCSVSTKLTSARGMSHGRVHTWYHGTIATGAGSDGEQTIRDEWYPLPTRSDSPVASERTVAGYNRARTVGGDPEAIAAQTYRTYRPDPSADRTLDVRSFHNGSFDLRRISAVFIPGVIPGWDYQGGSGGVLEPEDGSLWLQLRRGHRTATSNWTYVPQNVTELAFDYRSLIVIGDGTVTVELIDRELGAVRLSTISLNARSFGSRQMPIPSDRRGRAQKVRFTLISSVVSGADVLIRNVGFETARFVSASIDLPAAATARLTQADEPGRRPTLHAYDGEGRHTGLVTDSTSVAEIPGSRVVFYTDSLGTQHQRLVMPPAGGVPYRIEVQALGLNAPSEVDVYLETSLPDQPLRLAAYERVTLSAGGSIAASVADLATPPELSVDADGDGTAERQLGAARVLVNRTVTTTVDGPGSVEPGEQVGALNGDALTLTFVPDAGAQVQDVVVDGASVGAVESYTFPALSRDHQVAVSFAMATPVEDDVDLPSTATLESVYPNPTSQAARVRFGLPTAQAVRVELFDLSGRQIAMLDEGLRSAGWHTVEVDASALASGVYVVRLQAGTVISTKRLSVAR